MQRQSIEEDETMTSPEKMGELEGRVHAFNSLELPGQPKMMHMGTSYLINELWAEVKNLRSQLLEKHQS